MVVVFEVDVIVLVYVPADEELVVDVDPAVDGSTESTVETGEFELRV